MTQTQSKYILPNLEEPCSLTIHLSIYSYVTFYLSIDEIVPHAFFARYSCPVILPSRG